MNMRYEVMRSSVLHVKPIAADLRVALCSSVATFGERPRLALRRALNASIYARTAMLDGKPAAMWGMVGTLMSDRASAWLALTETALRHPVLIVREARRELAIMAASAGQLFTNIARDDERALALARNLGFQPSHSGDVIPGMVSTSFRPHKDGQRPLLRKERVNGPSFIIHALGRSRTAWLSEFLSYGNWSCLHEQAMYLRHPNEMRAFFSRPRTGYAETAASFGWPLIQQACPDMKQIVIDRHPDDAGAAMLAHCRAAGVPLDESKVAHIFERNHRVLRKIAGLPGTLSLNYRDLSTEDGCRTVFEACLPYEWDRAWWQEMDQRHVEADLRAVLSYYAANRAGIEEFKRLCRVEMFHIRHTGVHS